MSFRFYLKPFRIIPWKRCPPFITILDAPNKHFKLVWILGGGEYLHGIINIKLISFLYFDQMMGYFIKHYRNCCAWFQIGDTIVVIGLGGVVCWSLFLWMKQQLFSFSELILVNTHLRLNAAKFSISEVIMVLLL